jgi:hypothetical protein
MVGDQVEGYEVRNGETHVHRGVVTFVSSSSVDVQTAGGRMTFYDCDVRPFGEDEPARCYECERHAVSFEDEDAFVTTTVDTSDPESGPSADDFSDVLFCPACARGTRVLLRDGRPDRSEYRVVLKDGRYCDVGLWHSGNPSRVLGSFGGTVWPAQIPEIFAHFGPDEGCVTYRSGYAFRPEVELPTEVSK